MKNTKLLFLLFAFLQIPVFVFSQIQLEQTYSHSGTFTKLSNSGFKFYIMDVGQNQCRIYNTDHTLWKTINLSVPTNQYLYDIQYVSENLFTLDNSICLVYTYYAYDETNLYYTYTTRVIKENGTLLREIPGCQYYYVTDIEQSGSEFVTYSYDYSIFPYTIETAVFTIPGELVVTIQPSLSTTGQFMNLAPNPATDFITISLDQSGKVQSDKVILTDIQGNTIRTIRIEDKRETLTIPLNGLARGMYICSLYAGSVMTKSQKIVVQ